MTDVLTQRLHADTARPPETDIGAGDGGVPLLMMAWRIARRWRWVILGTVLAALTIAILITLLMTRQYTASSTVEIARESAQITDIQDVQRESSPGDQEFYQTQYGLLQARSLAEKVATDLRLVDDERFFQLYGIDTDDGLFAAGRANRQLREQRTRLAGGLLLHDLDVSPVRMSRLVTISFTSPDPNLSARVANQWAIAFIGTNLARKLDSTAYARTFLEDQLNQLRTRLERSEREATAYAARERIINLPVSQGTGQSTVERSVAADELVAITQQLAQATANRIEAQARYQSFVNAGGASAPALQNGPIGSLRQQRAQLAAEYEKLMVRFEPDYPQAKAIQAQIDGLDQSIQTEVRRVNTSLRNEYRSAQANEDNLQARVDNLKNNVLDLRTRSIQYNILQREADTNRQLYDALLQRYKAVGVAGGVGVNNVSVVDEATVPEVPSQPKVLLNLLAGLVGGLILGFGLAVILDQLRDTVSTPDELTRKLHLAAIGAVPKTVDEPLTALADRKSALFDAYLSVQTSLALATPEGAPYALGVTSTRAAEGKSTTALAIASVLSRQGNRVLLVDCDMRSPSVHALAGVDNLDGLSIYLAGQTQELKPHRFELLDIDVITAGPVPPNAAELLSGDRLGALLREVADRYDHVILDAPPVLGLADAVLVGNHADGMVFVIESGGMRAPAIRSAVQRLRQARVRLIGGILTKFDPRSADTDYAYSYGGRGYGYGRADNAA